MLLFALAMAGCGENEGDRTRRGDVAGEAGAAGASETGGVSAGGAPGGEGGDSRGGASGVSGTGGRDADAGGEAGSGGTGASGDGGDGGQAGSDDGGAGGSAAQGGGSGEDAGSSGTGGIAGTSGSAGVSGSDGSAGNSGTGGTGTTCAAACEETHGPNPCGAWTCTNAGVCVIAGCTDVDEDGYGVGTACACDLDCDDGDADVTTSKSTPCCRTGTGTKTCTNGIWGTCSAGFPATAEACDGEDDDCDGVADNDLGTFTCGTGACKVTVEACTSGTVTACVPLAPATSVDSCNEVDDDCDGAVDEDCSACLRVAPDGDDAQAIETAGTTPFKTVQSAIDFAASHPEQPTRICVASGVECGASATYAGPDGAELRMRNGIDLLGGYQSTTWTRCPSSTTHLAPTTGAGVVFGDDVVDPTVLDGFAIDRFAANETAGVSVRGARNVMLSNLRIVDGPSVATSFGVNVTDGGVATIFRSEIDGGGGTTANTAVRASRSQVFVTENCDGALSGGRCITQIGPGCAGARIRATAGDSFVRAIDLDSSAGSRIESSSVCAQTEERAQGLRIVGDATSTLVRGNSLSVRTSYDDRENGAVAMGECGGAAPWIVDNSSIESSMADHSVRAVGDCHPVIDSNAAIEAESQIIGSIGGIAVGIYCDSAGGVASRCVVVKNQRIAAGLSSGQGGGWLSLSAAVSCRNGACTKIAQNGLNGLSRSAPSPCVGGCTYRATGLEMIGSEALVDRNRISSGSAGGTIYGLELTGLQATDSRSLRVQNNVILAGGGSSSSNAVEIFGLRIRGGTVDVHSNVLSAAQTLASPYGGFRWCHGAGVQFEGAAQAFFRNNRMLIRMCEGPSYTHRSNSFVESTADADPVVFENNSFASYLNDLSTLTSAQVNALTDTTAAGNIPVCAGSDSHLAPGSTCENAGSTIGVPLYDLDGELRDAQPDIGPDEL